MPTGYAAELEALADTYAAAVSEDVRTLRKALLQAGAGPSLFVGTGGTLAVAQVAARLHEQVCAQPAQAVTPLGLLQAQPMANRSAILFSSSASHIDAATVMGWLGGGSVFNPSIVVTHRSQAADLAAKFGDQLTIVQLEAPSVKEGFLATNSVIAMSVSVLRAYLGDVLPAALPHEPLSQPSPHVQRLLVLTAPDLEPVATDLETRCSELGLADVQVTDYRNFAHGRHTGLARRANDTQVIGLVDESSRHLAEGTLRLLEDGLIASLRWEATIPGIAGVVELMVGSIQLASRLAHEQGVNPARPGAPKFGRRLYRLSLRNRIARPADGPVERKLLALGIGALGSGPRVTYEEAWDAWKTEIEQTRFGALVLDYDGTVCATGRRFDPPSAEVQQTLLRFLKMGSTLGFASGRGRSLSDGLREWVPRDYWGQVQLGLYNGAILLPLSEDVPDTRTPTSLMSDVASRLKSLPFSNLLQVEVRNVQVSISLRQAAFSARGRLAELIQELAAHPPELEVKVVESGHSVDVIDRGTSKASIIEAARVDDEPVLTIGDQGDVGGNDFELLAHDRWSLTVDRCSADPSRCWYADGHGRGGPAALITYLSSVHKVDRRFTLKLPVVRRESD